MLTCMHACMRVYVCVCVCARARACVCVSQCVCVCVCVCEHACVHACVHIASEPFGTKYPSNTRSSTVSRDTKVTGG